MAEFTPPRSVSPRGKPPVKKKKTLGIVIGAVFHLAAIGILCWVIFGRNRAAPDPDSHPEVVVARDSKSSSHSVAPRETPPRRTNSTDLASTSSTPAKWELPMVVPPAGLRPINTSPPVPAPPNVAGTLPETLAPHVHDFESKHVGEVFAVAALPDGNHVLSGGADRKIHLWDSAKAREIQTFVGTPQVVRALAVRFDASAAASGGEDGVVRIWDLPGAREAFALSGHKGTVRAVAFSPNGQYVLSGGEDDTVRLWDLLAKEQIREIKYGQPVTSVAFGTDGRRALIGGDRGTVTIYDLEAAMPLHVLTGHIGAVTGVAFSPDGKEAASVGEDTTLRFWDVVNGTRIALGGVKSQTAIRYSQPLRSVAYLGDGAWVAVAFGDSAAGVVQPHGKGRARITLPDKGRPMALAAFPSGKAVILATDQATVRRLDFLGGSNAVVTSSTTTSPPPPNPSTAPSVPPPTTKIATIAPKWSAGAGAVRSLAIAANGRMVTGGTDRVVRVWDPESNKEIHTFANMAGADNNVAISRDGSFILVGGSSPEPLGRLGVAPADAVLRVVTLKTGRAGKVGIHSSPIGCLAFAQNGRYALTGCEKFMRFWDVSSGRELRQYIGHNANLKAVDFHPKSIMAASVAGDNTARVWDLQSVKLVRTIEVPGSPTGVSFSPDGRSILVFGPGAIGIWDAITGKQLRLFNAPGGNRGPDSLANVAAAWAPNGSLLIAAGTNMALVDPETGRELMQFTGLSAAPSAVGVSGDGKYVAAAGQGVTLWMLDRPLTNGTPSESTEKSMSNPANVTTTSAGKTGP